MLATFFASLSRYETAWMHLGRGRGRGMAAWMYLPDGV